MKFALNYFYDPTQISPTEGEVAEGLTSDQRVLVIVIVMPV